MMPRRKILQCSGFTIIQLLFIIIIIAIITSLSLLTYQSKTEQLQIHKTAIQIQQILQAALDYYDDNSQWPQDKKLYTFYPYIPGNWTKNPISPWGQSYTLHRDNKKQSFQVAIITTKKRAQALAELLPNTQIKQSTENNYQFITKIYKTTRPSDPGIQVAGTGKDGTVICISCPSNTKPAFFVAPSYLQTGHSDYKYHYPGFSSNTFAGGSSMIIANLTATIDTTKPIKKDCYKLTIQNTSSESFNYPDILVNGTVKTVYIGICEKKS